MLTQRLEVLNGARAPLCVVAATEMTSGWIAGISGASRLENLLPRFPAAATSTTLLVVAKWMATSHVVGNGCASCQTAPRDMLTTSAPFSTAILIAWGKVHTSRAHSPSGGASVSGTLIGRILARGAMPATAKPLPDSAAAMPAT